MAVIIYDLVLLLFFITEYNTLLSWEIIFLLIQELAYNMKLSRTNNIKFYHNAA